MKNTKNQRKVALKILDGFGKRNDKKANAIALARKPFLNNFL